MNGVRHGLCERSSVEFAVIFLVLNSQRCSCYQAIAQVQLFVLPYYVLTFSDVSFLVLLIVQVVLNPILSVIVRNQ